MRTRIPFGKNRLCAVVAGPTARVMARQLARAMRETRTAEVRLDWLASDAERAKFLNWLERHSARATIIATCRSREAGGEYTGDLAGQLFTLVRAVDCGCTWCDVEIETARRLPPGALRTLLRPAKILISFHNFERTPRRLPAERERLRSVRRGDTDAIKVATRAKTLAEGLRVIALARQQRNVVAVPMGETCAPLRILALREGSALTYAPVEQGTAPGQVLLTDMRHIYRADMLGRETRVYGVIGNPIAHSLSPVMHNTAFQARRMDVVYLPFLVRDLRDFVAAVKRLNVAGFSVTLPHKHAILGYLDGCDPLAARIGAVNTVVVRGGNLYGYNTDYAGVLQPLEGRIPLAGSRVLIFGAGGAARAVGLALAQAGAHVCICSRRAKQARELARATGGEAVPRRQLRREFFDAMINATPVGMFPRTNVSPLMPSELHCRVMFDLIYRPMKTRLMRIARERGITTISGVDMFISQGIAQWELWTGLRAPQDAMRRAVLTVLRKEEREQMRFRRGQ